MKAFSLSVGKKPAASKPLKASLSTGFDKEPAPSDDAQLISGFDGNAGGAIDARAEAKDTKPTGPLVIPPPKGRDWRTRLQGTKRRNLLPAEEQSRRTNSSHTNDQDGDAVVKDEEVHYGLVVKKRKLSDETESQAIVIKTEEEPQEVKTADEEAMEALLGDGKKKSTLVIPAATNGGAIKPSEEEILRSELAELPDAPTVDQYAATPIADFGPGMLRGQGLREGGMIGRRNQGPNAAAAAGSKSNAKTTAKLFERRPALLGIGAKHAPKEVAELGAWGKGLKKKIEGYTPLVHRNKLTGEIMTEEEWAQRREKGQDHESGRSNDRKREGQDRTNGDSARKDRHQLEYREKDYDRRDRKDRDRDGGRDRDRDHEHRRDKSRDRDRERSRKDYDRQDRDRGDRHHRDDDRRERRRDKEHHDRDDRDYKRDRGERRRRDEKRDRDAER